MTTSESLESGIKVGDVVLVPNGKKGRVNTIWNEGPGDNLLLAEVDLETGIQDTFKVKSLKKPLPSLGIVIGRFQVPTLHPGHLALLEHVCKLHQNILIIIGSTVAKGTRRDPMDFETRKALFTGFISSKVHTNGWIKIVNQMDSGSDELWSQSLDKLIGNAFPGASAILYGGRDSFIPYYSGVFETSVVPEMDVQAGTTSRLAASKMPVASEDFRKGVIYGAFDKWPQVFPTVDIGIVRHTGETWEVLMAHKWIGDKHRFPGGFADPTDASFEAAAIREAKEETNLDLTNISYVKSSLIDDFRYKENSARIMTTLFVSRITPEEVSTAGDDVVELQWIPIFQEGLDKEMHGSHVELLAAVRAWCVAN